MWHADRGRLLLRTLGPVPLGLAYVLLVETNPFSELVVIFPDYALRISLGTFSFLLKVQRYRKYPLTAIEGPNLIPLLPLMIAGSHLRRRRRLTTSISEPDETKWPSLAWRLDIRRSPGERFLQKHILESIFNQIWTKAQSLVWRTFLFFTEACAICNPVSIVLEPFEDFRMEILNAITTPTCSKSNQLQIVNTVQWSQLN